METEKSGKIEYKIFYDRDIIHLMDLLLATKKELNHEKTELSYNIQYKDGTIDSGFDQAVINQSRPIQSVLLSLTNENLGVSIIIDINTNNTVDNNIYSVKSEDCDWVNEKSLQIQRVIAATPNQNYYLSHPSWKIRIRITSGILVSSFICLLLERLFLDGLLLEEDAAQVHLFVLLLVIIYMTLSRTDQFLEEGLESLYPIVDFDASIKPQNKKKKKLFLLKFLVIYFILYWFYTFFLQRMM
ncbi:hypothetical protein [Exiguobacterium sp. S22-S28]|uniref:hypothetical protein n=1 Tax=Exiguobacterium sp. S22-S28 TaxID=3342768 RepID=UPI00372D6C5D